MENIRYMAIGKRKKELTHATGSYIREAFGDAIQEIRRRIGDDVGRIYHFGQKLGNTTVIIIEYKTSPEIFVDIAGEKKGCKKTKSQLEKKFDIKLVGF